MEDEPADGTGRPNVFRASKISGSAGDMEAIFFAFQLTPGKTDNHAWLIPSLLNVSTIVDTYTTVTLPCLNKQFLSLSSTPENYHLNSWRALQTPLSRPCLDAHRLRRRYWRALMDTNHTSAPENYFSFTLHIFYALYDPIQRVLTKLLSIVLRIRLLINQPALEEKLRLQH